METKTTRTFECSGVEYEYQESIAVPGETGTSIAWCGRCLWSYRVKVFDQGNGKSGFEIIEELMPGSSAKLEGDP
jgi:hypothetical protein